MLAALAAEWPLLMARSTIAMIFGIVALVWPGLTVLRIVLWFGGYALADGIIAMLMARGVKGRPGFGSLLFEGVVRAGAGLLAFTSPGATALALPTVFGVWAVLSGAAA
jgi:uncharacterized membrane protein HdeD (DUF308 family)